MGGWKDVVDGPRRPRLPGGGGRRICGTLELRRGLGVADAVIDVHAAQWGTLGAPRPRDPAGRRRRRLRDRRADHARARGRGGRGARRRPRAPRPRPRRRRRPRRRPGAGVVAAPRHRWRACASWTCRGAPGRLLLPAAGRLRRGRRQGRGHRAWATTSLGAAAFRGRRRHREGGAVPGAQPRQAVRPARPQDRGRARGAPAPDPRRRRAARVLPAGRARPPRRRLGRLREVNPGSSTARSRATGRPAPARPVRARPELPRAQRRCSR